MKIIKLIKKKYDIVVPSRKVFLVTPVAETGVTIESLKYCIDSGFHNLVSYYPEFNASIIITSPINQFSVKQRKGRIGRIAPGEWYPCFTKDALNYLPMSKIPEILNQELSGIMLSSIIEYTSSNIKSLSNISDIQNDIFKIKGANTIYNIIDKTQEFDINKLDYLTNPSINIYTCSFEKLYKLGFIDYKYDISLLGFLANKFKIYQIEYIKMLLSGFKYGARMHDLITIIAGGSIGELLNKFDKNSKKYYKSFRYKKTDELLHNYIFTDDLLELIYLYNNFKYFISNLLQEECSNTNNNKVDLLSEVQKWCTNKNVNYNKFIMFLEKRDNIFEKFVKLGMDPYYNKLNIKNKLKTLNQLIYSDIFIAIEEIKKIKRCIFDGFYNNLVFLKDKKYYLKKFNFPIIINSKIMISKKFIENKPRILVATNLAFRFDNGEFRLMASSMSPMDCYINIDDALI